MMRVSPDGREITVVLPQLRARIVDGVVEQWDRPSQGLGDTVEKITRKLGIKPCGGCKRRRDKLNRAIPYRGKG